MERADIWDSAQKNLTYSLLHFSNLFNKWKQGNRQEAFMNQKDPAETNWFLLFILTENNLL